MEMRSKSGRTADRVSFWRNRDWLFGLLLVVATFVAYQPVWHAGFIWDDDEHLTQNPCIVGPLGFKDIWTGHAVLYYPLVLTSFWLQHALWGLNPLPYHLVNIVLHAACAVLLWRVLRGLNVPAAWLGAALWALHPVQVDSAAWITELKNTQSCFFYLLAIMFFFKMAGGWGACGSEGKRQAFPLRAGVVLCGAGDSEQVLYGDAARGARLVLVVDRWPVALA